MLTVVAAMALASSPTARTTVIDLSDVEIILCPGPNRPTFGDDFRPSFKSFIQVRANFSPELQASAPDFGLEPL